jgi:HTH-type transcriptional regulator / antitoxin HigA
MPRVINDKVDYQNTVAIIDALAGHKLTKDQGDYLELLSRLVEDYETENISEPKSAQPHEMVRFLLEENDLSATDLSKLLDIHRSQAFKILKGTRKLTVEHIRKLSSRFNIAADLFIP